MFGFYWNMCYIYGEYWEKWENVVKKYECKMFYLYCCNILKVNYKYFMFFVLYLCSGFFFVELVYEYELKILNWVYSLDFIGFGGDWSIF